MNNRLSCRLVQNFDDLVQLSSSWDNLVYKSDFPDIFSTSGFARAWWRAYGENRNMNLVIVEDHQGIPRLIAPFQAKKETPGNWELMGRPRGDYTNLIMEAGDYEGLDSLFNWLKNQPHWQVVTLRRIPGKSSLLNFFKKPYDATLTNFEKLYRWLNIGSWMVLQEPRLEHPICAGVAFQNMHDVLQHSHHRRKTNWFKTQGEFEYQVITEPAAIKSCLPQLFELHIKEWSKKSKSFLSEQVNRDFYLYIVDEMASYNALRFDRITLNGNLIAAHLGFHWAGRLYYWLACFDSAYAKGSPGRLLLENIIHSALKLDLNELDMLFGMEEYKQHFRSEIRKTGAITIYRSPLHAARLRKQSLTPTLVRLLSLVLG
ncbi:GNAT family N-acetyltransferase [bacterium]|nr:GNAT family N-acetyltransferase [bacterium]